MFETYLANVVCWLDSQKKSHMFKYLHVHFHNVYIAKYLEQQSTDNGTQRIDQKHHSKPENRVIDVDYSCIMPVTALYITHQLSIRPVIGEQKDTCISHWQDELSCFIRDQGNQSAHFFLLINLPSFSMIINYGKTIYKVDGKI